MENLLTSTKSVGFEGMSNGFHLICNTKAHAEYSVIKLEAVCLKSSLGKDGQVFWK